MDGECLDHRDDRAMTLDWWVNEFEVFCMRFSVRSVEITGFGESINRPEEALLRYDGDVSHTPHGEAEEFMVTAIDARGLSSLLPSVINLRSENNKLKAKVQSLERCVKGMKQCATQSSGSEGPGGTAVLASSVGTSPMKRLSLRNRGTTSAESQRRDPTASDTAYEDAVETHEQVSS